MGVCCMGCIATNHITAQHISVSVWVLSGCGWEQTLINGVTPESEGVGSIVSASVMTLMLSVHGGGDSVTKGIIGQHEGVMRLSVDMKVSVIMYVCIQRTVLS